MLRAESIHKAYGEESVLRGVDLTVEPGQISVLIGPSGSGKSTLLRCMALLDHPDQGRITLDGVGYGFPTSTPIPAPWPRITAVFQQLFLWPHLTLRENILLPLKKQFPGEEARINELVETFEMADFIDRHPNEASLGQRQRVALARALVLRPQYVLLDEITSSLDVEQVAVILSHLQLLRSEGIGILIVTHLLGFARRAADHIFFLDEGMILEHGTSELLVAPQHERVRRFLSLIEIAQ